MSDDTAEMATNLLSQDKEAANILLNDTFSHELPLSYGKAGIKIESEKGLQLSIPSKFSGTFNISINRENESSTINIGDNCDLKIYEKRTSTSSGTINISIGKNSKITWIENFSQDTHKIDRNITCKEYSQFTRHLLCSSSTTQLTNVLLQDHSKFTEISLFFGNSKELYKLETKIIHTGRNSSASIISKGVLIDEAIGLNKGILRIEKSAQESKTSFTSKILLLSKKAKAGVIPSLEIEADNVQAAHSAGVSQIDEEQLFYLVSKGLSQNTASEMIVQGFFEAAISQTSEEVKQEWSKAFTEKWRLSHQ